MTFDDSFMALLDEELGRVLPEIQAQYRTMFANLGFTEKNTEFVEFWSVYSDEIYGSLGYLTDLAMDLSDFPTSHTARLHEGQRVPSRYFSLFSDEVDDYLFYDQETDKVHLVEAGSLARFTEDGSSSRSWPSFTLFLQEFLELTD